MEKAILYVHGKGGNAGEAEQYKKHWPGCAIVGVDYDVYLPWVADKTIRAAYDELRERCGQIYLIANSIGAYFSMLALEKCRLEQALFISPIVDMEGLIQRMMGWAKVTEDELRRRGEIATDFGETLSWEYLTYVREHPLDWQTPTEILYAGQDHLTPRETVSNFAAQHQAGLTVMEEGEHWFHTEEQLAFLDEWMSVVIKQPI